MRPEQIFKKWEFYFFNLKTHTEQISKLTRGGFTEVHHLLIFNKLSVANANIPQTLGWGIQVLCTNCLHSRLCTLSRLLQDHRSVNRYHD